MLWCGGFLFKKNGESMQDERLRQIISKELKNRDRAKCTNEFVFRIWNKLGWNFSDPDHRQDMPSCETVTRIARDLKLEHPELKGSQKEQDRRKELEGQYRDKYSKRLKIEYPGVSKYLI